MKVAKGTGGVALLSAAAIGAIRARMWVLKQKIDTLETTIEKKGINSQQTLELNKAMLEYNVYAKKLGLKEYKNFLVS